MSRVAPNRSMETAPVEPESSPSPAALPAESPADALLRWADRYRWWIFGGIALLYLAGFNGQWRIGPDTALYAIVGRSVAEGNGYVHPLGDQQALTPGLPWLIAASFRLFDTGNFLAVQIVMWFMTLATLALFYHLIKLNNGRAPAVAITYMLAVTERFFRYAFELMADLPFLFGVLLFLVGYEATWRGLQKRAWPWMAMFVGVVVMALSRSVVLVFVVGLLIAAAWHIARGEHRLRHVLILLLSIGALGASRAVDPRIAHPFQLTSDERLAGETLNGGALESLRRIAAENLPELFETAAPEALFGIELGPVLNTIVALLVIGLGISLVMHRVLWACLVVAFLGQIVMFYFVVPRYFLPILPLLIAAAWLGANGINLRVRQPWGGWIAIVLTFAWTVPNIVKVCGTIIEQRRGDFYVRYEDGAFVGMPQLGLEVHEKLPPGAWLIIRDGRWRQPLTYFTRRRVITIRTFIDEQPSGDLFYLDPDLRRLLPPRVPNRLDWQIGDPLITIDRGPELSAWTVRRLTFHPTTQPATSTAN